MVARISRFRLTSTAFERADEENKIDPKKMVILSVEGDETERTYFQHLNKFLDNTLIRIEILRHRRGDGYSDPQHVVYLLNEYIDVRNGQLIPAELTKMFIEKYDRDTIDAYLNNHGELTEEIRASISEELVKINIDLEYRRYLQTFDKETDFFAVVLDRDCGNHSKELMEHCIKQCQEKGYGCFITNPCFEFWLLLHLCDVKLIFSDETLSGFRENPKVSGNHTMISREVSVRTHHGKEIKEGHFKQYYYPNIGQALERARQFKTSYPDLLDNLGTNLPELFGVLGYK